MAHSSCWHPLVGLFWFGHIIYEPVSALCSTFFCHIIVNLGRSGLQGVCQASPLALLLVGWVRSVWLVGTYMSPSQLYACQGGKGMRGVRWLHCDRLTLLAISALDTKSHGEDIWEALGVECPQVLLLRRLSRTTCTTLPNAYPAFPAMTSHPDSWDVSPSADFYTFQLIRIVYCALSIN